jgi:hypothetical protein
MVIDTLATDARRSRIHGSQRVGDIERNIVRRSTQEHYESDETQERATHLVLFIIQRPIDGSLLLTGKRPVKRRPAHFPQVCHMLPCFALVDQLPGVIDLLRRQFHLPAKLHATALRGFHSSRGCARR